MKTTRGTHSFMLLCKRKASLSLSCPWFYFYFLLLLSNPYRMTLSLIPVLHVCAINCFVFNHLFFSRVLLVVYSFDIISTGGRAIYPLFLTARLLGRQTVRISEAKLGAFRVTGRTVRDVGKTICASLDVTLEN